MAKASLPTEAIDHDQVYWLASEVMMVVTPCRPCRAGRKWNAPLLGLAALVNNGVPTKTSNNQWFRAPFVQSKWFMISPICLLGRNWKLSDGGKGPGNCHKIHVRTTPGSPGAYSQLNGYSSARARGCYQQPRTAKSGRNTTPPWQISWCNSLGFSCQGRLLQQFTAPL